MVTIICILRRGKQKTVIKDQSSTNAVLTLRADDGNEEVKSHRGEYRCA